MFKKLKIKKLISNNNQINKEDYSSIINNKYLDEFIKRYNFRVIYMDSNYDKLPIDVFIGNKDDSHKKMFENVYNEETFNEYLFNPIFTKRIYQDEYIQEIIHSLSSNKFVIRLSPQMLNQTFIELYENDKINKLYSNTNNITIVIAFIITIILLINYMKEQITEYEIKGMKNNANLELYLKDFKNYIISQLRYIFKNDEFPHDVSYKEIEDYTIDLSDYLFTNKIIDLSNEI